MMFNEFGQMLGMQQAYANQSIMNQQPSKEGATLDALKYRKVMLEAQLSQINEAIAVCEASPNVIKVVDSLRKLGI